ncbi:hypothetical protein [Amycolatopsis sp. lyj-346]|uniref:hypothetical protein n=1 Tax=Amycolatopsis sp. lyj-346 TaxID=2789289 RepID=UPI00397AB24D
MDERIQVGQEKPIGVRPLRTPAPIVREEHRVLLAYQRNAGNRAVQRLLANAAGPESVAQRQPAAPTDPNARTVRFCLSVETEGIGHAWIEVARLDGSRDSWGFWPAGASASVSSSGSGPAVYGSSAIETR